MADDGKRAWPVYFTREQTAVMYVVAASRDEALDAAQMAMQRPEAQALVNAELDRADPGRADFDEFDVGYAAETVAPGDVAAGEMLPAPPPERDFFDRSYYYGLDDSEAAELLGYDSAPASTDLAWELSELMQEDLASEVGEIDAYLGRAFPHGLLWVKGSSERWDGTSRGWCDPYGSLSALVADSGRQGLFEDCEIDRVWEGPDGSLSVRGVHHDGAVEVEVRVADDAQTLRFRRAAEAGSAAGMRAAWETMARPHAWDNMFGTPLAESVAAMAPQASRSESRGMAI